MATQNGSAYLMNRIFLYAKNVTGTNSYWFQQKNNLKETISQKGTPTIFWTLSCAEFHWPEFHKLFFKESEQVTQQQIRNNIIHNPHILDWFFTQRVDSFVKHWLYNILGAVWHWFRYEFTVLRGAIHVHGLAKLKSDPGLCKLAKKAVQGYLSKKKLENVLHLSTEDIEQCDLDMRAGVKAETIISTYADSLLTTVNPVEPESFSKLQVHPCKIKFSDIDDFDKDYAQLVNTVERHSKCNSGYCLREDKQGNQYCRFHYPLPLQNDTFIQYDEIETRDGDPITRPTIITKRNDARVNKHQRIQLQGWRANCDIQLILDHCACIEY